MIKIHAFEVDTIDGSQPLNRLLARVEATAIDKCTRSIGARELQIENISHSSGQWLFDIAALNFGAGPGRGKLGAQTQGFTLNSDEAFTESTACLYSPSKGIMLIEYKHNGARSGSVAEYLSLFNQQATNIYSLLLKLDPQVVTRLGQKQILSKFALRVAPNRLRHLDRQSGVALGLALDQTDRFGGQVLKIEVAVEPHSHNSLRVDLVNRITTWIRTVAGHGEDAILNAEVTGKVDPDDKLETLKLLNQKLEQRFDGYALGPDRRYRLSDRYDALLRSYHGWRSIL